VTAALAVPAATTAAAAVGAVAPEKNTFHSYYHPWHNPLSLNSCFRWRFPTPVLITIVLILKLLQQHLSSLLLSLSLTR
jgi:hypothetical protein